MHVFLRLVKPLVLSRKIIEKIICITIIVYCLFVTNFIKSSGIKTCFIISFYKIICDFVELIFIFRFDVNFSILVHF